MDCTRFSVYFKYYMGKLVLSFIEPKTIILTHLFLFILVIVLRVNNTPSVEGEYSKFFG